MHAISLIYGEEVVGDIEFCTRHSEAITRYSEGILTLQGSSRRNLEAVAQDPAGIPGWTGLLEDHPEDFQILQEFFARLIRYYARIGRLKSARA
jgi:hypothetical protein